MNSSDDAFSELQPAQQKSTISFTLFKLIALLAAVFLVAILAGTVGYLLGARTSPLSERTVKNNILSPAVEEDYVPLRNYEEENSEDEAANISITLSPMSTLYPTYQADAVIAARIPADWIFVKSTACNVAIPLPPKTPPYYDTRTSRFWQFWEFQQGGGEWEARAIFLAEDEGGSDGPASTVTVNCWPNTSRYTTATWFANRLSYWQNDVSFLSAMKPDTEEYHWGRNVLTAKLEGVDYPKFYLFSTKEHTYVSRALGQCTARAERKCTSSEVPILGDLPAGERAR
jgi:hypothetical protein